MQSASKNVKFITKGATTLKEKTIINMKDSKTRENVVSSVRVVQRFNFFFFSISEILWVILKMMTQTFQFVHNS